MFRSALCLLSICLIASPSAAAVLVPQNGTWRFLKGFSEASIPDVTAWREASFDDSGWAAGQAAFYYENQPGSANAFTGNTALGDMFGGYTCVFLRQTFVLNNPNDVATLQVTGFSDDGFIAWINGSEVGRFNMPDGDLAYSANSSPALAEPISWWTNTLAGFQPFLLPGTNILAIQAFNSSIGGSSDFVINPALFYTVDAAGPVMTLRYPPPGSVVRELNSIEIAFDEPVSGIDASDLWINNQPATNLAAITPSQFVFTFPPPPTGVVQVAWAAGHGIRDLSSASNAFGGGNWSFTLNPNAPPPGVMISEFMASNSGDQPNSVFDEQGNAPDWVEIFNGSGSPVSLTGWSLTDNAGDLAKWRFPTTLLPANSYLLVLASDRDTNVAGQLHTNFKLSPSPSYLALVDAAGNVISSFAPAYPQQFTDVSYGRDRFDPSLLGYFTNATPAAANANRGAGFGPEVQFSRASGPFLTDFSLVLTASDTNCDIHYELVTTNLAYGTVAVTNIPTQSSPLYTAPIAINNSAQVRARAFPRQPDFWPGPPQTESYVKISAAASSFGSDLPVILLHNLGGGTLSAAAPPEDQSVIVMVFEPVNGRTSLTNPPTRVARGGFNIRGSSTAGNPQFNLALEFWDEYNQDNRVELLGMPAESDWVLFAQNGFDPSYLHNPLMHQLSRDVGRYSARTRFAEVFLNTSGGVLTYTSPAGGNYFGLYTIEEKIKRDENRVNIARLDPQDTVAPRVTGGYLLKIDRADSDERSFYDSYLQGNIVFQDPPGLEMVTAARQAQFNYISSTFSQFGAALWGGSYTNPLTGYAAHIDVDSWLDHHILNVLSFNVDALRLSGFFYKDRNKKIEMGPLWDFDRSLGSTDSRAFNPRLWRVQAAGDQGTDFFGNPSLLGVRWWQRLFSDPDFWQRWIDRWSDLRRGPLATNLLFDRVDMLGNQARQAQARHVARWSGTSPRSGTASANGYSHSFSGGYQGELNFLKRWLADRVDFIDTNFLRAPVFSSNGGAITSGFSLTVTAPNVLPGTTTYYTRNGTDPRLPGGAINPAAFSASAPISLILTNNARIFARNYNPAHSNMTGGAVGGNPPISSPWSGAAIATFVVATPPLAITEIMYHPAPPASGTNSQGDFEFIELKNVGAQSLNLVGFRFTNGIDFTFTSTNAITNLGPNQYLLLVRNRSAFLSRYPSVTNIAGEFTASLDNGGEPLALEGPLREPILDFRFSDIWYPTTDGPGFSLVIRNESAAFNSWSNPASWRASSALGGSPGRADPPAPSFHSILVNEVLSHTDPPLVDSIELFNPTGSPVDIGGWFLTDDGEVPMKYRIQTNTMIDAGGYVLFTESQFGSGGADAFALSSLGEEIYLFSGDGTNITGYRHGFEFGAQTNGVSFGRHVTSDGVEHFSAPEANSLGGANSGPKVGPVVISEIMFAPPPFGSNANNLEEYIELRNITGQSVPLFDPIHATNAWRLDGGVQFTFPVGVTLPPQSYALVVNFSPDFDPVMLNWFRSRYDLTTNTPLFGPFQGNLANEGERVSLYLPDRPEVPPSPIVGFVPYFVLEEINYSDQSPWPAGARETGNSLQRIASITFGDEPANWQAGAPSPGRLNPNAFLADTDQDGLPDEWELTYGFDPKQSGGINGPLGDSDGDGSGNLHEYRAGTNPLDGQDSLRLTVNVGLPYCVLSFNTKTGRTYTVEAVADIRATNAWSTVTGGITGSGQPATVNDLLGASVRFYRLKVTPN
jgi:hypothetical protein